jgi:hypothetical protein
MYSGVMGFSCALLWYPPCRFPSGSTCGPHSVVPRRCPPLQEAQRQARKGYERFRSVSLWQRANPVPGSSGSRKIFFLSTLETDRALKANFTPATQHHRGQADAAGRVENPGHRAVQLPLTEQPMSCHPTATSATALLPRASAMVPRGCLTILTIGDIKG